MQSIIAVLGAFCGAGIATTLYAFLTVLFNFPVDLPVDSRVVVFWGSYGLCFVGIMLEPVVRAGHLKPVFRRVQRFFATQSITVIGSVIAVFLVLVGVVYGLSCR